MTDLERTKELLISLGIKFKEGKPYDHMSYEDLPGTSIIIAEDFLDNFHQDQEPEGLKWIGSYNHTFGFNFDVNGRLTGYGAWE